MTVLAQREAEELRRLRMLQQRLILLKKPSFSAYCEVMAMARHINDDDWWATYQAIKKLEEAR